MSKEYFLNEGHIHGAIDRLSVAMEYLDSALAQYDAIAAVPEYGDRVQSAIEILAELYQEIGSFDSIQELVDKKAVTNVRIFKDPA